MRHSLRIVPVLWLLVAAGCGGSQASQVPSPEQDVTLHVVNRSIEPITLSAMFGTSPASRLGQVPASGDASFTFFWRPGDLRIVLNYIGNRRATSNGIVDLQQGDRLELEIGASGTPNLRKVK